MLGEVNERLDRWCSAWEADDVEELADHYAENALVLLTDEEIWGPEAIQTALEESLPEAGPIAHELVDFEVSGSLAYVLGRFRYTETNEETGARVRRGRLLTILDKQSGNWKIRSQVFSEESPD
jgi:ketosteroid isomerase-like protein